MMYTPTPTYGFGYGYPQQYPQYQPKSAGEPLTRVSGRDEAAATFVQPNGAVALFHDTEPRMYIVVADSVGSKTVHEYEYHPVQAQTSTDDTDFVTKSDFEEFKNELRGLMSNGDGVRPATKQQRGTTGNKR